MAVLACSELAGSVLLHTTFGHLVVLGGGHPIPFIEHHVIRGGLIESNQFRVSIIQISGPFEISMGRQMGRGEIMWWLGDGVAWKEMGGPSGCLGWLNERLKQGLRYQVGFNWVLTNLIEDQLVTGPGVENLSLYN